MQTRHSTATTLTAVVAIFLVTGAPVDATAGHCADGVRRHHGLGEAGYCHSTGVRRYHGLGDGACARPYRRYTVPYYVIVRDERQTRLRTPIRSPLTGPERAWWLLGRGRMRQAQTDFAVLALRDTEDATACAGYALAADALGRHETAATAMRLAFVKDASAIDHLTLDPHVDRVVMELRAACAVAIAATGDDDDVDALFMFAALSLLLDDFDAARVAIGTVRQRDRTDPASRNLARLLHERRLADSKTLVAALPAPRLRPDHRGLHVQPAGPGLLAGGRPDDPVYRDLPETDGSGRSVSAR